MLQDDPAFRDDSIVTHGRMVATGPFVRRDRRRFRSTKRDTRFRLQPCPHSIGEYYVPSTLPDPAGDLAGIPSLRRPSDGDLGGRNFGKIPSYMESSYVSFPNNERKREASLYIISKFFPRKNFPRAILASTRRTICPTCRDATLACLWHSTNTMKHWMGVLLTRLRRGLLRPWCSSDLVAGPLVLF